MSHAPKNENGRRVQRACDGLKFVTQVETVIQEPLLLHMKAFASKHRGVSGPVAGPLTGHSTCSTPDSNFAGQTAVGQ